MNPERILERMLERIKESRKIIKANKEHISNFVKDRRALGKAPNTIVKYLYPLYQMNVKGWINKDFNDLTKLDMKEIVAKVESNNDWCPSTKKNFRLTLKVFYKWLEDIDEPRFYPERVRWIRTTIPKKDKKELSFEDLTTREEIIKMAQQSLNPMHRALVWVAFESTGRPQEVLNIRYSDIKFDDKGAVVMLKGVKDKRPCRLVSACEPLRNWLRAHPLKDQQDYSIWVTQFSKKKEEGEKWTKLGGFGANKILRTLLRRAGLKKRITMYSLRKGRLTELAKSPDISSSLLKTIVGWTQSSTVADRYIKFSHKDIDRAILKTNGFDIQGHKIESYIECKWCGCKCSPGSLYCEDVKCGKPLIITEPEIQALKKEMNIIEEKRGILEKKIEKAYPVLKILADNPNLMDQLLSMEGRK